MASKASSRARHVAAAVALAAVAALLLLPTSTLEVTHQETGQLLWRVPATPGTRIDLNYTNSLFDAPTTERFVVEDGHLRLVEISSTKQAVLEYLVLEPPYGEREGRFVSPRRGPLFAELTIRIGQTGQQRLDVGGRDVPLFRVGTGDAVRLKISRLRRAEVLLSRPHPP